MAGRPTWRSSCIRGRAVITTSASSTTMKYAAEVSPRTHPRRIFGCGLGTAAVTCPPAVLSNAVCAARAGFIFPPARSAAWGVHLSHGQTPGRRRIGRTGSAQFAARAGSVQEQEWGEPEEQDEARMVW